MRFKGVLAIIGLTTVLVLGAACSNGEAATTPDTDSEPTSPPSAVADPTDTPGQTEEPVVTEPAPVSVPSAPSEGVVSPPVVSRPAPAPAIISPVRGGASVSPLLQSASSQSGIWVTGQGSIALAPDLAVVNIGVETRALTVTVARDQAATAMAAIVDAVKAHGLTDSDIQTRSFNIFPRYDFIDRSQVFVGYTVSNSASIKIRELDQVGPIIDSVANAGGDATRINGISFTVEDTRPYLSDLRGAAVQDAQAKAQHFADLTGVALGNLVYIAELGGRGPVVAQDFGIRSLSIEAAAAPPTSISGGELELSLSVQAVYDIQ